MSKTSVHQKLAVLKPWLEQLKDKSRNKKKHKQPKWILDALKEIEDNDE
jgi:hypothetical protein